VRERPGRKIVEVELVHALSMPVGACIEHGTHTANDCDRDSLS
jgi:hypothetical protein